PHIGRFSPDTHPPCRYTGGGRMETAPQTTLTPDAPAEALRIRRLFTSPGVHPFDTVEWELRTAAVGSFRQDDVEFPTTWSQKATNIDTQKELRGTLDSHACD